MRIFSLEYIRQMINMDELHFISRKRKSQFKIKSQVGSFICNTRSACIEAYSILKQMGFQPSLPWSYGPFSIISNLRVELKTTPYNRIARPYIEKYRNQEQWEENTLEEAEERNLHPSTL